MSKPDLLTTADVAQILGVNVRTVNRMADDGRLRVAVKLPGLRGPRLFDRADVDAVKAVA